MAAQNPRRKPRPEQNRAGITRITVAGFKSISREQSIEIRPLTILAGANSSGKSSIMQPLLLLKQTLEATYDPGVLLLNGPNVRFTSADQLFSLTNKGKPVNTFSVGIEVGEEPIALKTYFTRSKSKRLDVARTNIRIEEEEFDLHSGMSLDKFLSAPPAIIKMLLSNPRLSPHDLILTRDRCFLSLAIKYGNSITIPLMSYDEIIVRDVRQMVHLPGLRGNPQRTYPVTAVSSEFPGTFENYVASVIGQWQTDGDNEKFAKVNRDLARLGLAGKVVARSIDDTQVELLVNRLRGSNRGR